MRFPIEIKLFDPWDMSWFPGFGNLPRYDEILQSNDGRGLRDGYNYTTEELATFFTAVGDGPLTQQESDLRDYLCESNSLQKGDDGSYFAQTKAVVLTAVAGGSPDDRKKVLKHERTHGLIESDPKNTSKLAEYFSSLSNDKKSERRENIEKAEYDSTDDFRVANETVAYNHGDFYDSKLESGLQLPKAE